MNFRTFLLIISLAILLASGTTYMVFTLVRGATGPREGAGRVGAPGPMYDIGTLTVNLLNSEGETGVRYMRTGVVLELDSERTRREVEQREPQIVDRILSVMRQQTVTSVTGAEGQEKLRAEIVASVNDILVQGRVIQVWFTDLVVQ